MNESLERQLGILPSLPNLNIRFHKKVFWVSILAGFIAHAYCMLNLIGTEDTIGSYSQESTNILSTFVGASTGRWLSNASNWLQTWYRTPLISGVLILLVIALLGQVVIDFYDIQSAAGMYLIAILLEVSSPTQAYMTLYEVGYPISVLLACLAALFMKRAYEKERPGHLWLGAWICLSLGLVILPVNLACTLTLMLMGLILQTLSVRSNRKNVAGTAEAVINGLNGCSSKERAVLNDSEKELTENDEVRIRLIWILKCLGIVVLAGAFLLISSRLLMNIYQVEKTGYQGAEDAMSGAFAFSIVSNYLHAIVKMGIIGLWKIQIIPVFRITYYVVYLVILICVTVLYLQKRKTLEKGKSSVFLVLELLLWAALMPVAICTMSILSYGFMYRGQHRMSLMLMIAGSVPLMERVLTADFRSDQENVQEEQAPQKAACASSKACRSCRLLYCVEILALGCMIYGSFLFDNVGYANQHHVMEQDRSLCTRILSVLDQTEGFTYDQPVYFLNILSWDESESVSYLQYDPELYSVIWPVATTDLYAYGDTSFRTHMRSYEGIVLTQPTEETIREIEDSNLAEEYADLQSGDFRIVEQDGTWVVVVKTVGAPNVKWG